MYGQGKSVKEIIQKLEEYGQLIAVYNADSVASISKINTDSRKVESGSAFVCITGFEADGHKFAENAVDKGAKLLIVDHKLNLTTPQLIVKNTRKSAAISAKLVFDDPTSKFKLIGVTGTNGKTTTTSIIYQIMTELGFKTALIGTFGYRIGTKKYLTNHTTPDIIELNEIFAKMVSARIQYVIMEVSSHAIALHRIFALKFAAAVFTNISQDHLDFHKTMENYAAVKFKLFEYAEQNIGISLINTDDHFGKRFFKNLENPTNFSTEDADYAISQIETNLTKTKFEITKMGKSVSIATNFIGTFNVFNLTAALATIDMILPSISLEEIALPAKNLEPVPGRLQKVKTNKKNIYIDFAHTPDALENVLSTLMEHKTKRIITLFGAGGERDKTKRSLMLKAAAKFSDLTILTNDNPRSESPAEIIRDILTGADRSDNIWIIRSRKFAIETAVKLAQEGDIVLLAGKGHENYQIIGNEKIEFCDEKEVHNALNADRNSGLAVLIDPLILEHIFDVKIEAEESQLLSDISTDSRSIKENSLFVALKGENFDGHRFVEDVLKKNCWAVVNDDYPSDDKDKRLLKRLLKVPDTLKAYGKIASHYRRLFAAKPIAITGTYGKTTVKEYLYNILKQVAPVLKTFKNENNLIGLPKTIFKLLPEHKFGIFELGSNQFGEIEKLTNILNPDVGIITAIGPSHLEFLENEDGVYKEKSSLFRTDLELRLYPGNINKFKEFTGKSFGYDKNDDYYISGVEQFKENTKFKLNEELYTIPTPFTQYALNAAIAVSLCKNLNIDFNNIKIGLKAKLDLESRMEIVKSKNRIILIDCYNANPDSMKASLEFWKNYHLEKPHIAILGDMLELGKLTKYYHKKICHQLQKIERKFVISVGNKAKIFAADYHFDRVEDLLDSELLDDFTEDAVILLKASHGIRLEKIIGRL